MKRSMNSEPDDMRAAPPLTSPYFDYVILNSRVSITQICKVKGRAILMMLKPRSYGALGETA